MIRDLKQSLTEDKLFDVSRNSVFIENIHEGDVYITSIAGGMGTSGYVEHKLDEDIENTLDVLKDLGVCGKHRLTDQYEDGILFVEKLNFEKVKLLSDILFDRKNTKSNCSLGLLKTIVAVIFDENTQIHIDRRDDKIDIEVLIDYLKVDDDLYVIHDIEVLVFALSTYKRIYIAKLLFFLLEVISDENKKELYTAIKLDNNFYYFENEHIRAVKESYHSMEEGDQVSYISNLEEGGVFEDLLIVEGKNEGNIYFYENFISKEKKNTIFNNSTNIKYDSKKYSLEYNFKEVNFSQAKGQRELIEKLYENMNNWITEDDIGKNGDQIFQTLKDIKEKMVKQIGKTKFSRLETKQLFQTFEDNKKRYFIMIG